MLTVSATGYTEAFYRSLAEGVPVQIAHERARQALYCDTRRHSYRRHRDDEEGKPIELRDWWLSHFYQQHPLFLQPTKPTQQQNKKQDTLSSPRLSKEMPPEPRYISHPSGFIAGIDAR